MTDLAVRCHDVVKSFGRTTALSGVSLGVKPATVHAVIGQNGAGKTTLMRVVAGELPPDEGSVEVAGPVSLVRQSFSLVPELTVLENVVFGAEPRRRFGRLDRGAARTRITALMESTGLDVPLDAEATLLPMGLQQRTEILAALFRRARVLLLDEPTAYLTPIEVDTLFQTVRSLSRQGLTTVFISHRMREVAENCDAVTVLWQGRTAGHYDGADGIDLIRIGAALLGGEAGSGPDDADGVRTAPAEPGMALTPSGAPVRPDAPVSLRALPGTEPIELREGHVIGVAGAAGNGQDELIEHVAGLTVRPELGAVELLGEDVSGLTVAQRRRRGLRIIPADGRALGCAPSASLLENMLTSEVPRRFRGRLDTLRGRAAERWATGTLDEAEIVYERLPQPIGELSGGNIQRLIMARELDEGARVLIAHEPCRGVDLAAAARLRRRVVEFARSGGAALVFSADLDELLEVSDEIVMLHRGALSGRVPRAEATRERLAALMSGTAYEEPSSPDERSVPVPADGADT